MLYDGQFTIIVFVVWTNHLMFYCQHVQTNKTQYYWSLLNDEKHDVEMLLLFHLLKCSTFYSNLYNRVFSRSANRSVYPKNMSTIRGAAYKYNNDKLHWDASVNSLR